MEIAFNQLNPATLRNLIEEFVTRDGTDYGARETPLDDKVAQVMLALETGKARIMYDEQSQTCDIVLVQGK